MGVERIWWLGVSAHVTSGRIPFALLYGNEACVKSKTSRLWGVALRT